MEKKKRVQKYVLLLLITLIFLAVFMLAGGRKNQNEIAFLYPEIDGECVVKKGTKEDVLAMLKHGSGIVFFSWSECPWCHAYIQILNEVARTNGLEVLYYDIYEDREARSRFYTEVTNILSSQLEKEGAFDQNGKVRIYVPDVTFVASGRIVGHDNQSSMLDSGLDIETYWSEIEDNGQSRRYNLKTKLGLFSLDVCSALCEIEKRGCTKCSVN